MASYILMVAVYALIGFGALSVWQHFFPPHKAHPTSSTVVGDIAAGGTSNITNINYKPEDTSQGLYVSLGSDRAMVGVYKEFNGRFELQLGAGETYDSAAVAEVTAKVKF